MISIRLNRAWCAFRIGVSMSVSAQPRRDSRPCPNERACLLVSVGNQPVENNEEN